MSNGTFVTPILSFFVEVYSRSFGNEQLFYTNLLLHIKMFPESESDDQTIRPRTTINLNKETECRSQMYLGHKCSSRGISWDKLRGWWENKNSEIHSSMTCWTFLIQIRFPKNFNAMKMSGYESSLTTQFNHFGDGFGVCEMNSSIRYHTLTKNSKRRRIQLT